MRWRTAVLKFIERNWHLPTISDRSRDNLPNPRYDRGDSKYAPTNGPAISDLFDLFTFDQGDHGDQGDQGDHGASQGHQGDQGN